MNRKVRRADGGLSSYLFTLKTSMHMKKQSGKKLSLGKIKIASLSSSKQEALKGGMALTAGTCSVLCSLRICTDNISQGAEICSEDSCRF